MPEQVRIS